MSNIPPGIGLNANVIREHVREYRTRRAALGHDLAEQWRKELLNGGRHIVYLMLPSATMKRVRISFGIYAARYEDLTVWERVNVDLVFIERKTSVVQDEPPDTHLSHSPIQEYRIP